MSLFDSRGVPVSTQNRVALDRYEQAVDLFHGYFADPMAAIESALVEDPDFAMGHCFKAGVLLTTTDKGVEPAIRASAEAVERLGHRTHPRERAHLSAIRAWLDGDLQGAIQRYGQILEEWPRDSLALQIAHIGDFFLGQSRMLRDRVARVLPHWSESTPGYGFALGMHAFGLEECGQYELAEQTGRRALDLQARDPWAVHAVAHVMEMQGRQEEGIRWLTDREGDWAPDNGFAFHNWWHLSLYHLDLGQTDRVLELYDRAIRPLPSQVILEMIDATALLWRLHLRRVDVQERWAELADVWEQHIEDGYYAFNDMHAMMALVATQRWTMAEALLRTLVERVKQGGTNARMTREVALPVCRALLAFGRGDYADAVELLTALRAYAYIAGGSHAQRDVLSLTLLEAALRAHMGQVANRITHERIELKATSPFNWTQAARARELMGDLDGAGAASTQAAALQHKELWVRSRPHRSPVGLNPRALLAH